MCLHSRQDVLEALKDSDHKPGSRFAVIWVESADGEVRGVPCVEATDNQQVANMLRNVRYWHPEAGHWTVRLEHLNLQRWIKGLPPISAEGLPMPVGTAPPSPDRLSA